MDNTTLSFVLGIAGVIIMLLFGVIGFFLKSLISDFKLMHQENKNIVEENGKNKGRIELVEQKFMGDIVRIEQMTQLRIQQMSESVEKLSDSVNNLIAIQIKRGNLKNERSVDFDDR